VTSPRKGIGYTTRAGHRALALFAFHGAAEYFQQALDLLEREPSATLAERCELLLALGASYNGPGRKREARDAFRRAAELARTLDDSDRLARAAEGFTSLVFVGESDPEGVRLLEEALAASPPEDSPARIRLLSRLALPVQSLGLDPRADALLKEAEERAERLGDAASLHVAANARENVLIARDASPERLLAATQRRRHLAELVGDDASVLWSCTNEVAYRLMLGDRAAAERALVRAAESRGYDFVDWRRAQYRFLQALAAGELAEAEAANQSVVSIERHGVGSVGWVHTSLAQLYALRREQDRLEELAPGVVAELERQADDSTLRAWRAQLFAEIGQTEACREMLARLPPSERQKSGGLPRRILLALVAEVHERLGERSGADTLAEQLAPYRRYHIIVGGLSLTLGPAARLLGALHLLCGELGEAERCFEEARTGSHAMGWTLWERYTELDEAQLLIARRRPGDRARARETAAAVLADARARGLVRLARRAEGLLHRTDAKQSRLRRV
jgi:tetratricopeptide (TPR) repeat protein